MRIAETDAVDEVGGHLALPCVAQAQLRQESEGTLGRIACLRNVDNIPAEGGDD